MKDSFDFELEGDEMITPLDNGQPGFRLTGLHDVQGTFAGSLDAGAAALLGSTTDIHELSLYGPDPNTRWWRHWFYRIRERLFDVPYPTVVLASGPATMKFTMPTEDGDDVVYEGTFTKAGKWTFRDGG
jgi:hypothetical protein